MATARRFSYSLLISTVAFGLFAVVAFSGLFPWIEAQFYSPRVVADVQEKLSHAQAGVEAWKTDQVGKLDKLLTDDSFKGVFSPTQSRDALQKRFQSAKLFLMGVRGGGAVRIFNGDLTQLHFSTEDSDVKNRTDFTIAYKFPTELTGLPDLKTQSQGEGTVHVMLDPSGHALDFLRRWNDSTSLISGWVLFSVSLEDLRLTLVEGGVAVADQPVTPLSPTEFLFDLAGTSGADAPVAARVRDLTARGVLPPVQRLAVAGGTAGAMTLALIHKGSVSAVIPASRLELDLTLKVLVLVSFYTVLFLVVFLIFNLRGEPVSVVSRKVKRFQLQVVRQYLDLKEQDKIRSLRDELTRHSAEIRSGIRRSLGRVRRKDQEWVDKYIDTSWQEVLDLLRGPEPPPESSPNADWKRLEALLQQALTQGRFVVSGAPATPAAAPPAKKTPVKAPAAKTPSSEDGDLEELDDVEELDEAEAVDDVEDLEDVEEAEAVEDAEELEEAEPVEDAEEAEELEEAEAVEDAEPADAEELGDAELAEAEAVEELESEPEEAEEVEELEELEPETEDAEAALLAVPARAQRPAFPARRPGGGVAVLQELEKAEDVEELDAPEDIEEFEAAEVEELKAQAEEPEAASLVTYALDQLDQTWAASAAGVFEESGEVVTLTDDVFEASKNGHDEFGQLVDEVLAGPDSTFVPMKEDLVPERPTREWKWTGGGFDWDRFAGADDDVSLFRALSDVVTAFDAFTAAIVTADGKGWKAQSSVGFSDAGKELLVFGPDSPVAQSCLSVRALHVLGGASTLLEAFHAKDLKFLKTLVCVPLLFRHEPAWLLLGLRTTPEDVLSLLSPRRIG